MFSALLGASFIFLKKVHHVDSVFMFTSNKVLCEQHYASHWFFFLLN